MASPDRIANLQYRMLLDYTERVERLHRGRASSNWLWMLPIMCSTICRMPSGPRTLQRPCM